MDWTTIFAAAAGGAIGLAGDLTGRLGARRQAARHRQEALEDAARLRLESRQETEWLERYRRGIAAGEQILDCFRQNNVPLKDADGQELSEQEIIARCRKIGGTLGLNLVFIADPALRKIIGASHLMIDLAITPHSNFGYSAREIIYTVRATMFATIPFWLRGEPLPLPPEGWKRLRDFALAFYEEWRREAVQNGMKVEPRTPSW
jgi:hypothetical protein